MTAALPPLNASALPEGLGVGEAQQQLLKDGPNELPVSRPRNMLRLVREVAFEPMFLLLVACGALYMALGDVQEALMLLGFVFVVMGISFVQQRRSERSLDALRDLSSPQARVRRAGNERSVAARDLVVGDVVMLAEGDRVPADLSLTSCANLAIDESLLTGESAPVSKQAVVLVGAAGDVASPVTDAGLAQAFSGTLVTRGTAWGQVIATGERSALGRIGQSLSGIQIETTPIQQETRRVFTRICHPRPGTGGCARHRVRAAAWRLAARGAGRAHSGDGGAARRTAGGADALPRSRCMATCARERAGPQHPRGRTAGRHHRAVRGQDRHIDDQSHGGPTPVVRSGGS